LKFLQRLIKDPSYRDLLADSVIALFVRVLGAGSAFIVAIVITRQLGAEGSGYYFLGFSILSVLAAITRCGLDNTVLRFVGAYPENAASIIKRTVSVVAVISIFAALLTYSMANFLSLWLFDKPNLVGVLQAVAPGVAGVAILTIISSALQGIRRVSWSIFVLNIAANLFLLLAIYVFGSGSAEEYSWYYSASTITTALLGLLLFFRYIPAQSENNVLSSDIRASCLPLWGVVVMAQMVLWSGQFIAGILLPAEDVAQLAVAQRTALLPSFILVAVSRVVAPKLAEFYRKGAYSELQELTIKSVKLTFCLSAPIIALMLLFPEVLINLFGSGFGEGVLFLQIMAVGQFFNVVTGCVTFLLMMTGHERDMRNITIASGVLSILAAWILTTLYGALGAAIGAALGVATQNLLAVYFVKKRLGINTLGVWK